MAEDGVIKFNCDWTNEPLAIPVPNRLKHWRDKMHQLQLIGLYEDVNIGYGNISIKTNQGLLISGTQTGHTYPIKDDDFALVTHYNMNKNQVSCQGKVKASAESLTHAAVYEADELIEAIIHIHNKELWCKLKGIVPTSDQSVAYGTAEMASEIQRLFNETTIAKDKIMVMAGHEDGLISFGKNLDEAGNVILNYLS